MGAFLNLCSFLNHGPFLIESLKMTSKRDVNSDFVTGVTLLCQSMPRLPLFWPLEFCHDHTDHRLSGSLLSAGSHGVYGIPTLAHLFARLFELFKYTEGRSKSNPPLRKVLKGHGVLSGTASSFIISKEARLSQYLRYLPPNVSLCILSWDQSIGYLSWA